MCNVFCLYCLSLLQVTDHCKKKNCVYQPIVLISEVIYSLIMIWTLKLHTGQAYSLPYLHFEVSNQPSIRSLFYNGVIMLFRPQRNF